MCLSFCWISDPVNELVYGRRGAIALSALLVFASSIGAAFTKGSWGLLFLCRALLGIGMGCKAAVVPVFAAEIAPAHLRGKSTLVMTCFGNMIADKQP
jgi:MFS family permease